MFLVTNRAVNEALSNVDAFGHHPNEKGPNELRIAEVQRSGKKWKVRILPDWIDDGMAAEVGLPPPNGAKDGEAGAILVSEYVARKVRTRIQPSVGNPKGKQVLLFVHGFNNDVPAVLDRALSLQETYGVEVIPFSWPANGGGIKGVASYRDDKNDAKISVGAFNRVVGKIFQLLVDMNRQWVADLEKRATELHGDDSEKWDRFVTHGLSKHCPFKVSLMLHSMGNYLFKHFMLSSTYSNQLVVFDNVVMVAADTNNDDHAIWVDRVQCRGRVFITLNENDGALRASRMKLGEQQKARLGHFPYSLNSQRAHYIDFTRAKQVGDSHAYFGDRSINNPKVKKFFLSALNGEFAEDGLGYDVARNLYLVP